MADTLLLDLDNWDLVADSAGNIAMATTPYSRAQDVASACKTFYGEVYYNTTIGIPYWENVLGHLPPINVLQQYLTDQAYTVPGVASARCVINSFTERKISGQVRFTDETGVEQGVSI